MSRSFFRQRRDTPEHRLTVLCEGKHQRNKDPLIWKVCSCHECAVTNIGFGALFQPENGGLIRCRLEFSSPKTRPRCVPAAQLRAAACSATPVCRWIELRAGAGHRWRSFFYFSGNAAFWTCGATAWRTWTCRCYQLRFLISSEYDVWWV